MVANVPVNDAVIFIYHGCRRGQIKTGHSSGRTQECKVRIGALEAQVKALLTQLAEAVNRNATTCATLINHGLATASEAQNRGNQNNTGDQGKNGSGADQTLKDDCNILSKMAQFSR